MAKKQEAPPLQPSAWPWSCPVPIRRSSFIGLRPRDALFNIETDLARVRSFDVPPRPVPERELLFADQQVNPFGNTPRRAGSGRAGFYRGKYLKGCGRTLLALNWNDRDLYHNSGHLFASAAIREYLISRYLEAKGASDRIVPCEGILLRPLRQELKRCPDLIFKTEVRNGLRPPPIDYRFQAITYKSAPFARFSNFVWFLENASTQPEMRSCFEWTEFFSLLARFLLPPEAPLKADDLGPERIAALFRQASERTMGYLIDFFRLGVDWGSFHNNFALDGRFLDLEVPFLFCGPFMGFVSERSKGTLRPVAGAHFSTSGYFITASQLVAAFRYLSGRFEFLLRHRLFQTGPEMEFVRQFARSLDQELAPSRHWLFKKQPTVERLLQGAREALELDARETKVIRRLLEYQWASCFEARREPFALSFDRLGIPPVRSEGPHFRSWYVPPFLLGRSSYLEEARWFQENLGQLEACKDLDQLMNGLLDFEKKIRLFCRPAAVRKQFDPA